MTKRRINNILAENNSNESGYIFWVTARNDWRLLILQGCCNSQPINSDSSKEILELDKFIR